MYVNNWKMIFKLRFYLGGKPGKLKQTLQNIKPKLTEKIYKKM